MTCEVNRNLDVIYEDEELLVINKAPGLMVHRSELSRGVKEFALQKARDYVGRHVYPVHRLDRPTSGVLIFALTKDSARQISAQFARRSVRKSYVAIVRGYLATEGLVDWPLEREKGAQPKEAVTRWRTLRTVEFATPVGRYDTARYSQVELVPSTGRRHQLRRHMAHLRHPIVGDVNYGDRHHNRFVRDTLGHHRLMLHAQSIEFVHPQSGETLICNAMIPSCFYTLFEQARS